jgi:hypothetical protein
MTLRSFAQNKFSDWQIARISYFEIEIAIENESDPVAQSFDCGDFVGYRNTFRINGVICFGD